MTRVGILLYLLPPKLALQGLLYRLQDTRTVLGPGSLFECGTGAWMIKCAKSACRDAPNRFVVIPESTLDGRDPALFSDAAQDIAALPSFEYVLTCILNGGAGQSNDFVAGLITLPGFLRESIECGERRVACRGFLLANEVNPLFHSKLPDFLGGGFSLDRAGVGSAGGGSARLAGLLLGRGDGLGHNGPAPRVVHSNLHELTGAVIVRIESRDLDDVFAVRIKRRPAGVAPGGLPAAIGKRKVQFGGRLVSGTVGDDVVSEVLMAAERFAKQRVMFVDDLHETRVVRARSGFSAVFESQLSKIKAVEATHMRFGAERRPDSVFETRDREPVPKASFLAVSDFATVANPYDSAMVICGWPCCIARLTSRTE